MAVARYLVMFERKSKYDQDSIVLEWFRYSPLAERGGNSRGPNKGRMNYYHLPYDGNYIIGNHKSLQILQNYWLCTAGMLGISADSSAWGDVLISSTMHYGGGEDVWEI
jgi:hypothetical protein